MDPVQLSKFRQPFEKGSWSPRRRRAGHEGALATGEATFVPPVTLHLNLMYKWVRVTSLAPSGRGSNQCLRTRKRGPPRSNKHLKLLIRVITLCTRAKLPLVSGYRHSFHPWKDRPAGDFQALARDLQAGTWAMRCLDDRFWNSDDF